MMIKYGLKFGAAMVIAIGSFVAWAPGAEAAGCLSGAAVGGVAGHYVGSGHGVAGAAVGCAVGHHEANVKAKAAAKSNNTTTAPVGSSSPSDSGTQKPSPP